MPISRFNLDGSVTTVTGQALIGVTNSSETVTDTVTPLHIALEPTGTGKRTRMDNDDYDAPTTIRVDAIAAKIKADGKDKYDNSRQYIDSVSIGSITGKGKTIFLDLSNPDSEYGLGIDIIKGSLGAIDKYSTRGNEVNSDNIDGPKEYSKLLGDINNDPQGIGGQQMATKITNLQNKHNSTSADNVFLPVGRSVDETTANVGMRIIPGIRGIHNKIENLAIGSMQENRIVPDDMLNLGIQIPVVSAGEWYTPKFGINQTHGSRAEQITLAVMAAMVPNPIKTLGTKRPVKELSAKSVLNSVRRDNLQINNAEEWPSLSDNSVLTHGSYYTWLVPFDGFVGKAQVPGTILLIIALSLPVLGLAYTIDGLSNLHDTAADALMTDIPKKEPNFIKNVMVGFLQLFGADTGNMDDKSSYSAQFSLSLIKLITTERIWKEYNLFNTIARRVIRDITENIQDIANHQGLDSFDKVRHFLTQSSVVKFVKMLADLGAAVKHLDHVNEKFEIKQTEQATLESLIKHDRYVKVKTMHTEHTQLAWSSKTTPSKYLLPDTIQTAAIFANDLLTGWKELNKLNIDLNMSSGSVANEPTDNADSTTKPKSFYTNRISKEEVKTFEDELNSSYMPFYLHDLRTNEIISFHAFIESMTDSFSANYDSQTGFGRVEPVHIYKNSSRDMGISFTVVATNAQDHSEMWWKINKLLTLVYPQYTKGRELTSGNDKFIQPYSQLIGASPMVRIRVGDVWKTNYSKFNVMRLFGLGESEFRLSDGTQAAQDQQTRDRAAAIQISTTLFRSMFLDALTFENNNKMSIGNTFYLKFDGSGGPSDKLLSRVDGETVKQKNLQGKYKCSITAVAIDSYNVNLTMEDGQGSMFDSAHGAEGSYVYHGKQNATSDIRSLAIEGEGVRFITRRSFPSLQAGVRAQAVPHHRAMRGAAPAHAGGSCIVEALIDKDLIDKLATNAHPVIAPSSNTINTINTITNFFKGGTAEDSNPIMQAFESTAGEGIAGFISSIGIDWNGSRWETEWKDGDQARAPQMCKIDIKFLPVHDISPGLASNGFMTAPIYTVGKYANAFKKIKP